MTNTTIRTPDQRVRVFVSSTLQELEPERVAVRDAIEQLRLHAVMFELGARPHPPQALYHAYLEQSHIFIGVYWERYGWIAPGMDISGLEDEYVSCGERPRLMYVKEPAPNREERLTGLLKRIQADDRASYKRFSTTEQLAELVSNDLAVLLSERFEEISGAADAPVAGSPARQASARRRWFAIGGASIAAAVAIGAGAWFALRPGSGDGASIAYDTVRVTLPIALQPEAVGENACGATGPVFVGDSTGDIAGPF